MSTPTDTAINAAKRYLEYGSRAIHTHESHYFKKVAVDTRTRTIVMTINFHLFSLIFPSTIHFGTKLRKLYIEIAAGIATNIIGNVYSRAL